MSPLFFRDLGYWGRVAIAQGSSTSSPYAAETPKAKEPLAGAFTGDVRPRYATALHCRQSHADSLKPLLRIAVEEATLTA